VSCCVPGSFAVEAMERRPEEDDASLLAMSRTLGDGNRQIEFAVPDAHCAACIRTIETSLSALPGVVNARVNLTRRRVRVVFDPSRARPSVLAAAIRNSGYHTYALDPSDEGTALDSGLKELVTALAVAGFAAGNIMLFSVSIWSGANDATRDLFHWLSAFIALPAIAFAGRVFFRSAWRAVRVGKTNMDVPISIGIILATGLSLYETIRSGGHAYFDASTMLLFFLLIGRTLDHLMRERARGAITNLARLQPRGATCIDDDGRREYVALAEIEPGMRLEVQAGERVPVDAVVETDGAVFDYSVVTGETRDHVATKGSEIVAGALNAGGPVVLLAQRASTDSFVARMAAMMEAAEGARTRPRRIADRAAAVYAPIVHTIAFSTFIAWLALSCDWHLALTNAVAVLIITCPCALALAVPIVHVVAAGRLFERGILMKDGGALERIAEIDSVAFDKTGTLTLGHPRVVGHWVADERARTMAFTLAAGSNHPISRAVATFLSGSDRLPAATITEIAGRGLETKAGGTTWRFGSPDWCGVPASRADVTEVAVTADGSLVARFEFSDPLRADAAEAIERVDAMRIPVRMLSGDAIGPVTRVANLAGIWNAQAGLLPEEKVKDVSRGRTLMVGDGINDAPALRAAYASMAPASAADIGRCAADFVFTGSGLGAVPFAIDTARRAARLVNQNLVLAIGYNAIAVPLAIFGYVTPLIAAVAMSLSSIIVVANALRLRFEATPVSTTTPVLPVLAGST
jgi:P-type Cu2+ transporter